MARYIDANVLKEKLLEARDAIPLIRIDRYSFGVGKPDIHGQAMRGGIRTALRCMEQTPTADVVEVVRCKDCAVLHNKWLGCPNLNGEIPPPDFYCARGERKSDNGSNSTGH